MYPAQLKIPEQKSVNLTSVKDIQLEFRFDATGQCIKDMTCDPYGHPAFAAGDDKIGSLVLYDAAEGQLLRRIGAGHHSVDSATFDSDMNFSLAEGHGKEKYINTYGLKADKVRSVEICDVEKIYSISCMGDGKMAVSVSSSNRKQEIRIYSREGSAIQSLVNDSKDKPLFSKASHITSYGARVIVSDVIKKSVRCFNTESDSHEPEWVYPMEMPRGLCVDSVGNICVCDFRNNRITLLSPHGKVIGHAPTGLSKPQFVSLMNNIMYTVDMGRSTSYRVSGFRLYKSTRKHSKPTPEWQS